MIRDSLTQIDVSVHAPFTIAISRDVSAHQINVSPGDSGRTPERVLDTRRLCCLAFGRRAARLRQHEDLGSVERREL